VPGSQPRVVLATHNLGKVEEMRRILSGLLPDIEVLGLDDVAAYDEPAETEPTFEGNARLKADAALAATGIASLADDSGLCVDALNGMPGVLSARWAGVAKDAGGDLANNRLLLAQLADVPDGRRTAAFRCAVAVMPGRVIREMRGTGGFGYDVLFCADGYDRTTAELPPAEKDALSHRGQALRRIAPLVVDVLGGL
jgi:XTP/dITP diphosphohydrolase